MRSKSEAVMTLDRINRDVGVGNEIFMDNAPDQTVHNIDMQILKSLPKIDVRITEPHS